MNIDQMVKDLRKAVGTDDEGLNRIADVIEKLQYENKRLKASQPVRCKECIWWQDKQVLLNDGTYRDYLPADGEHDCFGLGMVSSDVGINVGSHCFRRIIADHGEPWFWSGPDDFCSRGERRDAE